MFFPKNMIADFYMYQYLVTSEETIDKDLELDIKYGALVFLDKLKEYLLTVLEYSIIREISHVWWETIDPNTMNPPSKKYMERVISEKIYYILLDLSPDWVDTLSTKPYTGNELQGCSRLKQYMFIKTNPYISTFEFISIFKKYFTKLVWLNNHGGEVWESITNYYLKLVETNGEDLFILCDSIFWLQHNTNTVFNKIKAWEQNGSYEWINKFLDFRKECDLWELLEHCSESKKLATKKLKLQYNKTVEEVNMEEVIMNITLDKIEPIKIPTMDDIAEYTNKPVFEAMKSNMEMLKQELAKIDGKFDPINEELAEYITWLKSISEKLDNMSSKQDSISNEIVTFRNENNEFMTKVYGNQQNILLEINELGERISSYQNSVIQFRQNIYEDMEQLHKTVSHQWKNYVDQITKSITEKFERELVERTNAILEKLEQRWYKRLLKYVKNIFSN